MRNVVSLSFNCTIFTHPPEDKKKKKKNTAQWCTPQPCVEPPGVPTHIKHAHIHAQVTGAKAAFKAAGKPMPPLRYKCINRIPYARGMGSSSAAIIAGLIGGLVLAGHQLPMWGAEELLQLACEIEVGRP